MSVTRGTAAGLLLAGLVVFALVLAARPTGTPSTPAARAERLASELRCPVCQGLSVADSPSETAAQIRDDLRRRIGAGESDAEIRQAYVDRFGDWILLRPRRSGIAAVLWALPVALVIVAGAGLAFALRRWNREVVHDPSGDDRDLVAKLRADKAVRA